MLVSTNPLVRQLAQNTVAGAELTAQHYASVQSVQLLRRRTQIEHCQCRGSRTWNSPLRTSLKETMAAPSSTSNLLEGGIEPGDIPPAITSEQSKGVGWSGCSRVLPLAKGKRQRLGNLERNRVCAVTQQRE